MPDGLPSRWSKAIKALDGRIFSLEFELLSAHRGSAQLRELTLQGRRFGTDAEHEHALRDLLTTAGLTPPEGKLLEHEGPLKGSDGGEWRLEVFPLIAPPGEAREIRLRLSWDAAATTPADARCKRPPQLTPTPSLSRAARIWAPSQRTRRLLSLHTTHTVKTVETTLGVWLRNAEVLDYNVKTLNERLGRLGYAQVQQGQGTTQLWRHPNGASVSLQDTPRGPRVGCEYPGMVMSLKFIKALN
ncbi:MAG: hypothetical protein ACE366_29825 [Bradymonadia bacterium]